MTLQAKQFANSIGQGVFNYASTEESVRKANLRLRQENTCVSNDPAEEETHMSRVTALINHLVKQARDRDATNL
jgi:hypothetical protein